MLISTPPLATLRAHCAVVAAIDDGLELYGYLVDAPGVAMTQPPSSPPRGASTPVVSRRNHQPSGGRELRGARYEILRAVESITARSGERTFTLAEIVDEMRGSRYAESTVRTMVCSHLCAQAQGPGIDAYTDLERVGRGVYRQRQC